MCEGGFRGRVLQGTVGVLRWECERRGGVGRVGNNSLRVLYRLFLLLFHLSHWGLIFLRLTAPSLIKHYETKAAMERRKKELAEGFINTQLESAVCCRVGLVG